MAEQTPNYGLKKPGLEEFYDVELHNDNMDIIDKTINESEQQLTQHLVETKKWVTALSLQTQVIINDTNVDIVWSSITPRNGADFAKIENGKIVLNPGLYQVNVFVMFDSNPVGGRFVNVENAVDGRQAISTSTYTPVSIGVLVQKNIQSELSIKVNQNSGGALNIIGGSIYAQIAKVADVI